MDKKDTLIAYEGKVIAQLQKSLLDRTQEGINHEELKTKPNKHFVSKQNKHRACQIPVLTNSTYAR